MNTFISSALNESTQSDFRRALLLFLDFQDANGAIVDGIVERKNALDDYNYFSSRIHADLIGFKNTVETDQESSLVQAFAQYIEKTGDIAVLQELSGGKTVLDRLAMSMQYLINHRTDSRTQLLWGGTTVDWGDVQPETSQGILLDSESHPAIDIYDNAMFIMALRSLVSWLPAESVERKIWQNRINLLIENIRIYLWNESRGKYFPHIYLAGSPFPVDFRENEINFYGGTIVAIQANLLTKKEFLRVYNDLKSSILKSGANTVGLTIEPAYPDGFFKNPIMKYHEYQNGGEWDWFGCRWVSQLVANGLVQAAFTEIKPIASRQLRTGFYEWYTLGGEPRGANNFKGSAGTCSEAIDSLKTWAKEHQSQISLHLPFLN